MNIAGVRFIAIAGALVYAGCAQSPTPEYDPEPTGSLGGGPANEGRSYEPIARPDVVVQIARLASANAEDRRDACSRLRILGPAAFGAVDALVGVLGDPRIDVLEAASAALADIVPAKEEAVIEKLLAAARSDPAPSARGAVKALAKMRLRRADVQELLAETAEHFDFDLRMSALQGIVHVPVVAAKTARVLGVLVGDPAEPEELRIAAAEALRRLGSDGVVAGQDVVRAVVDRRAGAAAAKVFNDWGPFAAPFARPLGLAYDGKAYDILAFDHQFEIARAIDRVIPGGRTEESFIRSTLKNGPPALRDEAAYRAGRDQGRTILLGPDLAAAALRDPEPRVRARAAAALGLIGDSSPTSLGALMRALRDPAARFEAAVSIAYLQPTLEGALAPLASDPNTPAEDRAALWFAAARLDPSAYGLRSRLAAILSEEGDPFARAATLVFLGVLRDAPRDADALLAKALVDPNEEIRQTARWTLARCRPQGPQGRGDAALRDVDEQGLRAYWLSAASWWNETPNDWEMLSAISDYRHRVRYDAPRERPAAPPPRSFGYDPEAIRAASVDPDARVREVAARRIAAGSRSLPDMTPFIVRLLGDVSRRVRVEAAHAAAATRVNSRDAEMMLAAATKDPCWTVRLGAIEALQQMRAASPFAKDAFERAKTDPVESVRDVAFAAAASAADPASLPPPPEPHSAARR